MRKIRVINDENLLLQISIVQRNNMVLINLNSKDK